MQLHRWRLIVLATQLLACATPVGVERAPAREVHRAITANVISTGQPSATAMHVLQQRDLADRYQRDADAVLELLRASARETEEPVNLLCALAELSFHRGERLAERVARGITRTRVVVLARLAEAGERVVR